jgi:hypothetical protein
MSYLAMSAAPIDNSYNGNNDIINKKRQHNSSHAKTQKSRQSLNADKVNSVLETIHSMHEEDNELGNYSNSNTNSNSNIGNSKQEGMTNNVPQPTDNDDLRLQDYQTNFMNDSQVKEYYRKLMPDYKQKANSSKTYYEPVHNDNSVLIEKLNYMIHLLEEQQDQKTDSATEDVILYSFLGIFMIFIVDSFTKVGKYVR